MERFIDRSGSRFGKLLVLQAETERDTNGAVKWICRCDCGSQRAYAIGNAKRSGSCGCVSVQRMADEFPSRLAKYIPEPNSGCWLWTGGLSKQGGYGQISIGGRSRSLASRTKTQMQIADDFGCDQTTVSLIKLGRRWRHVV